MGLRIEKFKTKRFILDLNEQAARERKQKKIEKIILNTIIIGGLILWLVMVSEKIV
tara:strand:+ start:1868 stop:2035 length:168 start_codon:yes stop_codon:yes gene_type:complete